MATLQLADDTLRIRPADSIPGNHEPLAVHYYTKKSCRGEGSDIVYQTITDRTSGDQTLLVLNGSTTVNDYAKIYRPSDRTERRSRRVGDYQHTSAQGPRRCEVHGYSRLSNTFSGEKT